MQSDEQEIRMMLAAWMEATKAGDAGKVLALISDDVVFLRHRTPEPTARRRSRPCA